MAFEETLENGMVLRTVRDEQDIARYVAFNTNFNNPDEGLNTDILIRHFPGARYEDYQLIEDPRSGEIVSTTCLIPWVFDYEGIQLRAAQLEQVLTHPAYRRHGLVRLQMERFLQTVRERSFDLSFIWGIPYYYRQYGYAYCLDGSAFEELWAERIPAQPSGQPNPYVLRPATLDDVPELEQHYRRAMSSLQMAVERTPEHWRYLLKWAKFPVYLIENVGSGKSAGYLGLEFLPGSDNVTVLEGGITSHEVGLEALRLLKRIHSTSNEIRVGWPEWGTLARLAHDLGSHTQPGGQWLFQITDPAAFLKRIGPVLERRLAGSDCAGITRDWVINLFRQAYKMCFREGRLSGVEAVGFVDSSMGADGGDVCIPSEAFTRLALGYRTPDQLYDAWPDIVIKPESRRLVEVLFPRINSYLYSTYRYFGSTDPQI